jgi:hypothetical protein
LNKGVSRKRKGAGTASDALKYMPSGQGRNCANHAPPRLMASLSNHEAIERPVRPLAGPRAANSRLRRHARERRNDGVKVTRPCPNSLSQAIASNRAVGTICTAFSGDSA